VSSKAASRKRRQAARLRQMKRQRKCGRVPQHTLTERRRQALERLAGREVGLRRIQRVKQGAAVAAAGVGASVMAGLMLVPVAAASTPHVVTGAGHYHPGVVSTVPVLTSLSSLYGPLVPGRQDEMPHNEFPDPTPYGGDAPNMGTAPSLAGLTGPRHTDLLALETERYGSWSYYGLPELRLSYVLSQGSV
jgi:hypothetical protein